MAWFKWYENAVTDAKIQCVAKISGQPVAFVIAVWAMILERASAADDRGSITGFDCESADAALQLPDGAACAIFEALKAKEMITDARVVNWDKRQLTRKRTLSCGGYAAPKSNAERQRAYRERQKALNESENGNGVTQCNGNVTESNVTRNDVTQCNVTRNGVTESNAPLKDKIREEIKNINLNTALPAANADCAFPAGNAAQDFTGLLDAAGLPAGPEQAPPEGRHGTVPGGKPQGQAPPDGPHYRARSGKYLTGKRLETFLAFWEAFAYARGKSEAADAWLAIPQLTDAMVARICDAARQEAAARDRLMARGGTPKWAQGWLNARRWEDYEPAPQRTAAPARDPVPRDLTAQEQAKADAVRRKLEARRRGMPMYAASGTDGDQETLGP